MSHERAPRWRRRPILAVGARSAALLLPLVVSGLAAALVLDVFTGAPAAWRVVWWTGVVVCSIVAAVASVPVANRLSALGLLLGVDVDFPSAPPSRVRVAVGMSTMVAARNELARSGRGDSSDETQTARMVAASMVGVFRVMDVRVEDRVRVYSALGFAVCVAFASLIVVPDRAESPQSPFSTAPEAEAPVATSTTGPSTTDLGTTVPGPGTRGLPSAPTGANSGVTNSARPEQDASAWSPTTADAGPTPIGSGGVVDGAGPTAGPTQSAAGPTRGGATSTVAAGPIADAIAVPVADNAAPDIAAATAPSVAPSPAPSGEPVAVAALAPVLSTSVPPGLAALAPDVVASPSAAPVPVAPSTRSGGLDDTGGQLSHSPVPGVGARATTPRDEPAAAAPHTDDDLQSAKARGGGDTPAP